jgi:hypothetical protein
VIVMSLFKKSILCVMVVTVSLTVLAAVGSAAFAATPWWHVSSGSLPENLHAGLARSEVEELTISATGGHYIILSSEAGHAGGAFVNFNATREELQKILEENIYGVGNVQVTGGPGDEQGSKPYVITFTGELADAPITPLTVLTGAMKSELTGGREEAKLTEVVRGRPDGQIVVTAANLGDAPANGETVPVRVADKLPAGLRPVAIAGGLSNATERVPAECALASLSCSFAQVVPYNQIEVLVSVVVENGAKTGEVNEVSVSGGEAQNASVRRPITVSGTPTAFGVEDYEMVPEEPGGGVDTQAGSHPFQLTTTLTFNRLLEASTGHGELAQPAAPAKDLHFKLPPGLIGNPTPFPQCTIGQFLKILPGGSVNECAEQTAVGVVMITIVEPTYLGVTTVTEPLFNLAPSVGEPARFGFFVSGGATFVLLDTAVRTGGDYGVTVDVNNIAEIAGFMRSEVTFWGVPGDARHNNARGWGCLFEARKSEAGGPCSPAEGAHPPPLLTLPTQCAERLHSEVEADSWPNEGSFASFPGEPMPTLDGCNRLPFNPSIEVAPDGQAGSTPTGLAVSVHVPQDVSLNATGLAEADVKDTTVALPVGVAINPAGADGLQACSEEQIALSVNAVPSCPDASKVGVVKIKTPLLPNQLEGAAYLASQNANPFGSLVALYVFVEDPVSGSRVKLAGEVVPDPVTGQLVSTFKNTPQLPFETFELHFFGGNRAPLSTPGLCGAYTTTASIAPWSGNETIGSNSTFNVISGPNGSPCNSPLPFNPALTAGTTSIQAGGFSPFTMTMSRPDGSQNLQAIQLKMPPGLLGTLATVKLCKEEQANAGTCGPESLIGHTTVSVGVGGDPFTVTGGQVFITESYKGAPYGLSIVNPAKAGPFDLGKVIVRAKIEVDQTSAVLTITTDTSGPYKIPTILDGIPLQIQHVNVAIDRSGFTFNPTNCSPLAITGSLTSDQGSVKDLSVPFQITNCAVLAFKPKLTAKTNGKTSRSKGASLSVKLTYPAGPYDANISKVKVDLPKQLPSRLTTLQQACPAKTFEANPAACPSASIVGHAKATTPVLPTSLEGPAYFVSHGGEEFPELIIVLQGYGTTVHLVGSTFISKAGITSSTFKQVPDVPVGTFELTLPQGKFSALAANGNLCTTKKLAMPTSFIGQNGAVIKTSTPIVPTGCARHKKAKKAPKRGHANRAHH